MQAHAMVDGTTSKSFAEECKHLCESEDRVTGVKSHQKYNKREADAPLKCRCYYLHEPDDVLYTNLNMKVAGLPNMGKHSGLGAMYNIRTDPDLGLGKAALRRMPCACDGCISQLNSPWEPGVPAKDQKRYKTSNNCKFREVFVGFNDWMIVDLMPGQDADEEQIEEMQEVVLQGIAMRMADGIEVGNIVAFMTDDPDADGYYVAEVIEGVHTLQEDLELNEYDPPVVVLAGKLVCRGKYWSKLAGTRRFYYPDPSEATTLIRLKHVVDTCIDMDEISDDNPLPNNYRNKTRVKNMGAKSVSSDSHEFIMDEISKRELLEHDERIEANEEEEEYESVMEDEESHEDVSGDDSNDD